MAHIYRKAKRVSITRLGQEGWCRFEQTLLYVGSRVPKVAAFDSFSAVSLIGAGRKTCVKRGKSIRGTQPGLLRIDSCMR